MFWFLGIHLGLLVPPLTERGRWTTLSLAPQKQPVMSSSPRQEARYARVWGHGGNLSDPY
jgi:hypothetical protein